MVQKTTTQINLVFLFFGNTQKKSRWRANVFFCNDCRAVLIYDFSLTEIPVLDIKRALGVLVAVMSLLT
jgi:hypothetical protein